MADVRHRPDGARSTRPGYEIEAILASPRPGWHEPVRTVYFFADPHGLWFAGLSETSKSLARLRTASSDRPRCSAITCVGVLPATSFLSSASWLGVHACRCSEGSYLSLSHHGGALGSGHGVRCAAHDLADLGGDLVEGAVGRAAGYLVGERRTMGHHLGLGDLVPER